MKIFYLIRYDVFSNPLVISVSPVLKIILSILLFHSISPFLHSFSIKVTSCLSLFYLQTLMQSSLPFHRCCCFSLIYLLLGFHFLLFVIVLLNSLSISVLLSMSLFLSVSLSVSVIPNVTQTMHRYKFINI